MHDNLIREREGRRLPLEVRLGSQVDIVTQMTKWTRNTNLTLNIGLRVSGLFFGFSGSPCFQSSKGCFFSWITNYLPCLWSAHYTWLWTSDSIPKLWQAETCLYVIVIPNSLPIENSGRLRMWPAGVLCSGCDTLSTLDSVFVCLSAGTLHYIGVSRVFHIPWQTQNFLDVDVHLWWQASTLEVLVFCMHRVALEPSYKPPLHVVRREVVIRMCT